MNVALMENLSENSDFEDAKVCRREMLRHVLVKQVVVW
jgi:pentatricopeptide repeat protein